LPDAELKIYLDAEVEQRVDRRLVQLKEAGREILREEVKRELEARDELDQKRTTDPLKRVPEAWYVDTSRLDVEEVVEKILVKVKDIQNQR
jgi:cytidylate kinase